MAFVEDNHMIQAVASDAADEPFHEGILLWTARCRAYLLDTQAGNTALE
jgi:hypothetical protein